MRWTRRMWVVRLTHMATVEGSDLTVTSSWSLARPPESGASTRPPGAQHSEGVMTCSRHAATRYRWTTPSFPVLSPFYVLSLASCTVSSVSTTSVFGEFAICNFCSASGRCRRRAMSSTRCFPISCIPDRTTKLSQGWAT